MQSGYIRLQLGSANARTNRTTKSFTRCRIAYAADSLRSPIFDYSIRRRKSHNKNPEETRIVLGDENKLQAC